MDNELERMRNFEEKAKQSGMLLKHPKSFDELMKTSPELRAVYTMHCRNGIPVEALIIDLCTVIQSMREEHLQTLEKQTSMFPFPLHQLPKT